MHAHDIVVIGSLVDRCPSLLPILQEHLDDYDDCLLSHVFMSDVTRWAVQRYVADPHDPELESALAVLNQWFAGDRPDDTELIAVSFLENLPSGDEVGSGLRDAVGPALREHLARYG